MTHLAHLAHLRLIDISGHLDVAVLGRMSTRAKRALVSLGIKTVNDLFERTQDKASMDRLTPKVRQELCALAAEAAEHGINRLVFGRDSAPTTADDLLSTWLDCLGSGKDRAIADARYLENATLQQIGERQNPPLTRERIRQIIEKNLTLDRGGWRAATQAILEPLEMELDRVGGILPVKAALRLVGATSLAALEFCVDLVDAKPCLLLVGTGESMVVTRFDREGTLELIRAVWAALDEALELESTRVRARQVLAEFGLTLDAHAEETLLRDVLRLELEGDRAFSGRRWVNRIWEQALLELGGPRKATEVRDYVRARHPEVPASLRNAAAHFRDCPQIFAAGGKRWIHADELCVSRTELGNIAQACIEALPRRAEASSVQHVLARVANRIPIPKGLDPRTVRDAMLRTGQVRGWRGSLDVGWRELTPTRTSIEERIQRSLESLERPFHVSELVKEVATLGGTEEGSVQVHICREDFVAVGDGEYYVMEELFPTRAAFEAELSRLEALVPTHGVISAMELALRASSCGDTRYEDSRLAAALAARSGHLRVRFPLVWRAPSGDHPWSALACTEGFPFTGVFKERELVDWLKSLTGTNSVRLASAVLRLALSSGAVERIGHGKYVCPSRGGTAPCR
jgi:hypothetical protein